MRCKTTKQGAIFQEGMPPTEEDCIHYYGSEIDVEKDHIQKEDKEPCGSLIVAHSRGNGISKLVF